MSSTADLLNSILSSENGLTLADLLALIASGQVIAAGEGRSRRYFSQELPKTNAHHAASADIFPAFISLSADSQDILQYLNQPLEAHARTD